VVAALAYYFENLWHQASPLDAVGDANRDIAQEPSLPFTSAEHLTLQMLAEGTTDEAIARKLDISVRTVRRTVVKLIQVLGARSRFEAAVLAAKRGWV
jgi:DNA-binding NarL/FixJ family response regulator